MPLVSQSWTMEPAEVSFRYVWGCRSSCSFDIFCCYSLKNLVWFWWNSGNLFLPFLFLKISWHHFGLCLDYCTCLQLSRVMLNIWSNAGLSYDGMHSCSIYGLFSVGNVWLIRFFSRCLMNYVKRTPTFAFTCAAALTWFRMGLVWDELNIDFVHWELLKMIRHHLVLWKWLYCRGGQIMIWE